MRELLIEKWFPVHEASIESTRERSFAYLPPLHILHVWWARRPQTASRIAAVLAALPAEAYGKQDFKRLLSAMGLRGDPVRAAERRVQGQKGFDYPVFEGVSPNPTAYLDEMVRLWGRRPVGADFMAGGGSIPFEMIRSGYGEVIAGEYNPLAYLILKAALEYPLRYGERLPRDVDAYGKQLLRSLRQKVKDYYPQHPLGQPFAYIWVRMFRCPECGCEIPALFSLWLDRKKGYALYPVLRGGETELKVVQVEEIDKIRVGGKTESRVRIIEGEHKGKTFETKGYVQRGVLECPRHRHTVSAEEVKRQYREHLAERERGGYHGSHPARLAAAVLKGRAYVEPTEKMRKAYEKAEEDLKERWSELIQEDLIPIEIHEKGESDGVVEYGLNKYERMFNARQLLVHAEIVRLIREIHVRVIEDEARKGRGRQDAEEYAKAITTYLTIAFGKTLDYNSTLTRWDSHQGSIANVFDTHAYAWTWDFGEGDMIQVLKGIHQWALNNSLKALKGLVKRIDAGASKVEIVFCDASKIGSRQDSRGYDVILIDPPYYGNVQYGELSDYFYVWFKRILKDIYPEAFGTPETPKMDEAVANSVRHGSTALANKFYERKMSEVFTSIYRVLRDDGAFILWFAHKAGAAWSRTINSLLDSGFKITALWGVRTEMERSLHISGKAALRTSILMVCRKREEGRGGYIQDVMRELEKSLEPRLAELEEYGIMGPDFIMGAQAEALRVASRHWPLRDPEGRQRPLELLDFILDQAVGYAVNYVTRKVAPQMVGVDAETKFYVLARYLYGDIIPYDDARRLSLACLGASGVADPVVEVAVDSGLGEMATEQLEGEKAKILRLTPPWERVRKGRLRDDEKAPVIDWIHRAISILEEGKGPMDAALMIARGGGSACEVLSALYQILPDQITEGRRTMRNREKLHVQTLLLSVCQEGLHLAARRQIMEREAQRRLEDFEVEDEDLSRYDPIIDQFMRGSEEILEVNMESLTPTKLERILKERVRARGLEKSVRIYLAEGTLRMEKVVR